MEKPTLSRLNAENQWTKKYLDTIRTAIRNKDWETAERYANEISAIWGTYAGLCEQQGRKENV